MIVERSRTEGQEQENNPTLAVAGSLSNAEIREATNAEPAPEAVSKAKKYFKEGGGYVINAGSVVTQLNLRLTLSLLKFAREVAVKRGNVGFSRGYEIGSEIFSLDGKKDKKS